LGRDYRLTYSIRPFTNLKQHKWQGHDYRIRVVYKIYLISMSVVFVIKSNNTKYVDFHAQCFGLVIRVNRYIVCFAYTPTEPFGVSLYTNLHRLRKSHL